MLKTYVVIHRHCFARKIERFEARDEKHLAKIMNEWFCIRKEDVVSIREEV